ncbi:MAG: hypothetical protein ABW020_07945, partial [Candidatus Rokuibacteriota bacterium]
MTRRARRLAAVATLLTAITVSAVGAHELQPGFLDLRETARGRYDVVWKLPSVGAAPMQIAPVFPEACRRLGDAVTERAGPAWLSTGRIACERSLAGQTIAIDG